MNSPITTAFVLAAGLGKRLRPLTDSLPKPLVPIFGKPLLTFALDHLIAAGVSRFVVNTHHLPDAFTYLFPDGTYRGFPLTLIHEPVLLETGGGIRNARHHLGDQPFLVYSGDVLTDIDLSALLREHAASGNDVTLALRDTGFAQAVATDGPRVTDLGGRRGHPGQHDFANVSIWQPHAIDRIPPDTKISFIPVLADWIGSGGRIGGLLLNDRGWFNVGSPTEYFSVHATLDSGAWCPSYLSEAGWPRRIDPSAQVHPTAQLAGITVLGAGAEVSEGACLIDTILWPGAKTASRIRLERCIVRSFAGESATDAIL